MTDETERIRKETEMALFNVLSILEFPWRDWGKSRTKKILKFTGVSAETSRVRIWSGTTTLTRSLGTWI
jgi:hypothetical protein